MFENSYKSHQIFNVFVVPGEKYHLLLSMLIPAFSIKKSIIQASKMRGLWLGWAGSPHRHLP